MRGGIHPDPKRSLVWVDRRGAVEPVLASAGPYSGARISPDGGHIAFYTLGLNQQVWTHDVRRGGEPNRLTTEGQNFGPIWTPDGKRVTFSTRVPGGFRNLFWRLADGSGPVERLTTGESVDFPSSWSRDGQTLAFVSDQKGGPRIRLLALANGPPGSRPLAEFRGAHPEFSPDGHWLAYTSDESGRDEVYVRAYPDARGRYQVSTDGGFAVAWAASGREMFYYVLGRAGEWRGKMMAVDITTSPEFSAGKPRMLFEGSYGAGGEVRSFDVTPDARRFLMVDMSRERRRLQGRQLSHSGLRRSAARRPSAGAGRSRSLATAPRTGCSPPRVRLLVGAPAPRGPSCSRSPRRVPEPVLS